MFVSWKLFMETKSYDGDLTKQKIKNLKGDDKKIWIKKRENPFIDYFNVVRFMFNSFLFIIELKTKQKFSANTFNITFRQLPLKNF